MNERKDDDAHEEGLIDLSALMATRSQAAAPAAVFRSEPPPAAFTRDAAGSQGANVAPGASKAKTIAMVAGAVAVLILGGVGIAFAFRGEKPVAITAPPPARAAAHSAPPPAVDPAPTAESDDGTTSDSDTPTAKKAKGTGKAARGGGSKSTAGASGAGVARPAVKAADPCHCHGDFQCNIRCSAGR